MMSGKRTVTVSVLIVLLVGVIQELRSGSPTSGLRRFMGVFFFALFLAILAEIAPKLAGGIAVLTAVATVLAYEEIFDAVNTATGSR